VSMVDGCGVGGGLVVGALRRRLIAWGLVRRIRCLVLGHVSDDERVGGVRPSGNALGSQAGVLSTVREPTYGSRGRARARWGHVTTDA